MAGLDDVWLVAEWSPSSVDSTALRQGLESIIGAGADAVCLPSEAAASIDAPARVWARAVPQARALGIQRPAAWVVDLAADGLEGLRAQVGEAALVLAMRWDAPLNPADAAGASGVVLTGADASRPASLRRAPMPRLPAWVVIGDADVAGDLLSAGHRPWLQLASKSNSVSDTDLENIRHVTRFIRDGGRGRARRGIRELADPLQDGSLSCAESLLRSRGDWDWSTPDALGGELADYDILVAPDLLAIPQRAVGIIERFVSSGGAAAITGRTLLAHPTFQQLCGAMPVGGGLEPGAALSEPEGCALDRRLAVHTTTAEPVAHFQCDGTPAVMRNKYGAGWVIYVAGLLSDAEMFAWALKRLRG